MSKSHFAQLPHILSPPALAGGESVDGPVASSQSSLSLRSTRIPMQDTGGSLQVTESEDQLVLTAQEAVFQSNWIVGECAAKWTERYARGRTDADFAVLVGLSGDQVYQRRRVWEVFHTRRSEFQELKWSHFYAALTWDDAQECLEWAEETHSTVAEMRAWRRALRGEDLSVAALDDAVQFLPSETQFVEMPGTSGSGGDPGERGAGREGAAELKGAAVGVARELGSEGDYTPFKSGASTPPGKGAGTGEPPTTEQLTRRMTSALEKFVKAMGRHFDSEFAELPDKVRARFLRAVRDLQEAVGDLA